MNKRKGAPDDTPSPTPSQRQRTDGTSSDGLPASLALTSDSSYSPRKEQDSMSNNPDFSIGGLDVAREAVCKRYGKVTQQPLDWFLDNCIARVDEQRLNDAVEALQKIPVNGLTNAGRVTFFSTDSPSQNGGTEKQVFRGFGRFVEQILNKDPYKRDCEYPTFTHSMLERSLSGNKVNSSRADGYGYLGELDWPHTILAEEFKLKNDADSVRQNRKQIVWSGTHMLRDDARRNFAFGLTIEDTQAQLWRFSRSGIIVSEPFLWIQNPRPLIQFILSLVYYPTIRSEYELALGKMGFDPSLEEVFFEDKNGIKQRALNEHGDPLYRFTMDGHDYETVEVITNYKADDLLGRATRVWRVRRLNGNEPPNADEEHWVMKECWAETTAETEGEIWNNVKKRVTEKKDDKLKASFYDHFLVLEAHQTLDPGDGVPQAWLDPADVQDSATLNIFGVAKTLAERSTASRAGVGAPMASGQQHEARLVLSYPRRKQRTLWKGADNIEPLDNLQSIQHMHQALLGTCEALEVLYKIEMIHRDVSCGNVYYDKATGKGRLGDLEFVKPYGQSQGGHIKTGTPLFWSPEVQKGDYVLSPTPELGKYDFAHHYLHDAESIYWLLNYILTAFEPKHSRANISDIDSEQRKQVHHLYLPQDLQHRLAILQKPGTRPLNLPNGLSSLTWTVGGLLIISKEVGGWINQQYAETFHPPQPSAPFSKYDPKLDGAAISAPFHQPQSSTQEEDPESDDDFMLTLLDPPQPPRLEPFLFSHDSFSHVFPKLREKIDKVAKKLHFSEVLSVKRNQYQRKTRLKDEGSPRKDREHGYGEIVPSSEADDANQQEDAEGVESAATRGSTTSTKGSQTTEMSEPVSGKPVTRTNSSKSTKKARGTKKPVDESSLRRSSRKQSTK